MSDLLARIVAGSIACFAVSAGLTASVASAAPEEDPGKSTPTSVTQEITEATLVDAGTAERRARKYCDPPLSANSHVEVCFEKEGDIFWIHDRASDGRSGMMGWDSNHDKKYGICRNSHGAGTWAYCNKKEDDLTEGTIVSFQGWTQDHGGLIDRKHDGIRWRYECTSLRLSNGKRCDPFS